MTTSARVVDVSSRVVRDVCARRRVGLERARSVERDVRVDDAGTRARGGAREGSAGRSVRVSPRGASLGDVEGGWGRGAHGGGGDGGGDARAAPLLLAARRDSGIACVSSRGVGVGKSVRAGVRARGVRG